MNNTETIDMLHSWISEKLSNAPGVLVPVSGGSDGALVCKLLCDVLGSKVKAVHFGQNLRNSDWFSKLCTVDCIPLSTEANLDPEAHRWAMVASICLRENRWAVSSRNRTEVVLGTYSRPSDYAGFYPISGIWKSTVIRLCECLGVPTDITESSRKPDPACGRPKELSDIGIEQIDAYLRSINSKGTQHTLSADQKDYLDDLIRLNNFKRQLPHVGYVLDVD